MTAPKTRECSSTDMRPGCCLSCDLALMNEYMWQLSSDFGGEEEGRSGDVHARMPDISAVQGWKSKWCWNSGASPNISHEARD